MPDIPLNIIQGIHRVMKAEVVGYEVAYSDLAFFLAVCNDDLSADEDDDKTTENEVVVASQAVRYCWMCKTTPTKSNEEPIRYHLVLSGIEETIDQLIIYVRQSNQQVADPYNSLFKHAGSDLVSKIGKTVEVANLQYLFEKLLHAVQDTSTDADVDKLSQLSEQIGGVLTVRDQ